MQPRNPKAEAKYDQHLITLYAKIRMSHSFMTLTYESYCRESSRSDWRRNSWLDYL